jgi:hypothetical protein
MVLLLLLVVLLVVLVGTRWSVGVWARNNKHAFVRLPKGQRESTAAVPISPKHAPALLLG